MALVKFVSDKDCQIFVDKECVGEVNKDSILKHLLEPGEYLVEVKDANAHILMMYNLEIKATDNQILQDMSERANSLDDVINQLKDNPCLEFHCNRAAFCHNGLYGYVNKRFEVVIPAIYTIANIFKDNKAFVVREFPEGMKTTLIDEDGNMFFNRWFDYIGESETTILLGIENRIIVYSKVKYDKTAEYYNAGYDHKASLVPVYKKVGDYDFYGYIDYDGKVAIPFIFNNAGTFDEKGEADVSFLGREVKIDTTGYYQEGENGYFYKMKWDGDLQGLDGILNEKMPNFCSYDTGETRWDFLPIWNNYKWIIRVSVKNGWPQKEIKSIDYYCDYVLEAGTGYWILKTGEKALVLIANVHNDSVEEYSFDADNIEPVFDVDKNPMGDDIITSRTFILKRKDKYGVFNTLGEELIPVEFDEIIPFDPYEFAVRKAKKYGVYSAGKFSAFEYDNVTKYINSNNEYSGLLLEKKGKFGLWKNSSVIPPLYDHIDCYRDRYVVSLNGVYGIIDDNTKELLPIKYEKILPLGNEYFKVKTEKGWSLGYIHHGIIYPNTFDDITFLSEKEQWLEIFLVKNGDKYGCINDKGELILPINNDKIILDSSFYTPRVISILTYKDGKIGFCIITYFYSNDFCCKRTGTHNFKYIYYVEPQFDECVLERNLNSVLGSYYMHYAAVRKENKWGILDQKPRNLTYIANDLNLEDINEPNWEELNYKYDSIEELKEDADKEFDRRRDKYFQPWDLYKDKRGKYKIIKKELS